MDRWERCYNKSWQGLIVPEAFSHPAKFSRGLIYRIYQHAKEKGWVKPGNWVLDPFGGVALGGLEALEMGFNWIGVELEEKFVKLGEQNIELWQRQFKDWPNLGMARIVQGNSRNLKAVIKKADIVINSPPFQLGTPTAGDPNYAWKFHGDQSTYGHTPGNLANMKESSIDAVISSPPYEGCGAQNQGGQQRGGCKNLMTEKGDHYNRSNPSNLGNTTNDSFWSASRKIVQQCFDLLKPGGHAIWVTKDYVKNKKRVPFSDRWLALCESVGFGLVCRHQAMLVENYGIQTTIMGEDEKITTERKSFFRRLAEKKGSPRIDYEDVICLKK